VRQNRNSATEHKCTIHRETVYYVHLGSRQPRDCEFDIACQSTRTSPCSRLTELLMIAKPGHSCLRASRYVHNYAALTAPCVSGLFTVPLFSVLTNCLRPRILAASLFLAGAQVLGSLNFGRWYGCKYSYMSECTSAKFFGSYSPKLLSLHSNPQNSSPS